MIRERQKLDELLATLKLQSQDLRPPAACTATKCSASVCPSVDNPLRQPYAAFNQPELLTILIENLVGHYLARQGDQCHLGRRTCARRGGRARRSPPGGRTTYCSAQPNSGAGILICDTKAADKPMHLALLVLALAAVDQATTPTPNPPDQQVRGASRGARETALEAHPFPRSARISASTSRCAARFRTSSTNRFGSCRRDRVAAACGRLHRLPAAFQW